MQKYLFSKGWKKLVEYIEFDSDIEKNEFIEDLKGLFINYNVDNSAFFEVLNSEISEVIVNE